MSHSGARPVTFGEPPSSPANLACSQGEHQNDGAFRHEALFYSGGDHGFLAGTFELVNGAAADGAPVLVAVGPARAAALKEALGANADGVFFAEMQRIGRNPAQIIPVWQEFIERHGGQQMLGIGEPVWPGRSPAELDECERHEQLLNVAFDDGPGWHLLCPYDLDGLDEHVIEAAQRTHPLLAHDGGGSRGSEAYRDPYGDPFAGHLPSHPGDAWEFTFTSEVLADLRRGVAEWADRQLLALESGEELVLAVNELATNSILYAGGRGTLRLWRDGQTVVAEVHDLGRLDAPPLLGRVRPKPDAQRGRGVWIANQLCDLVQIRSTPDGTVVRVHKAVA
ncbi:MAG: putative signal transduction histidine kinase [Solirubrobacterales bacterium]|nr:putative signal transduction histidine kinase [Solirubrobacterales bacterium]